MFTRPSLVKTQIKRNKKGKKVLMKTLGIFDIQNLADRTFDQFSKGKSITQIFQENSIAKKHTNDFKVLLLNKFLKSLTTTNVDANNIEELKNLARFSKLSTIDDNLDLGFVYCIKINDKIKIGRTVDIIKRLSNYKSHNGDKPEVIKVIFLVQHSKHEKTIINNLNEFSNSQEWFNIDHKEKILEYFK